MSSPSKILRLAALSLATLAAVAAAPAHADPRTVCTITVNSPDEKEAMRKHLPPGEYKFVELVEHGRPDWLASACSQQVSCDVLVVSGHFNGRHFFSDRLEASQSLAVDEMTRASCSNACPGLFSKLKEVYLFGCTSLNGEASRRAGGEMERSLVRAGHGKADAERIARGLAERYGESNRDVMRRVFVNTPAIYGFSSVAPLGPIAGGLLNRYFQGGRGEFGTGRVNQRLLANFSAHSLAVTSGIRDTDASAATYRAEVCRFVDERETPAQKLRFIHAILGRDMAEARIYFERIETFLDSLDETERADADFTAALADIARDERARERYMAFARDADQSETRARMTNVAQALGWLSPEQYRAEMTEMIVALLGQRAISVADVALVCSQNDAHALDATLADVQARGLATPRVDQAATLACLGSADDHARMLAALTSPDDDEVRLAEVYFHQRPITDLDELRFAAVGVARMSAGPAQVRALDVLSRHHLADRESLFALSRLYATAGSVGVQRALAGVLLRAEYRTIASPELVRMLRERRLRSPDGEDMVDILIRRLQAAYATTALQSSTDAAQQRPGLIQVVN